MRRRYYLALAILATYFIASYFVLHGAIDDQRSMQRAISASGQQRMYSQRIAMFAEALAARPGAEQRRQAKTDLETSIRIFEQAHVALTDGDPDLNPSGWPPPNVKRMYFDPPLAVDAQVRTYLAHARAVDRRAGDGIAAGDRDLAYLLDAGPGPLLQSLDAVVAAYTVEQRAGATTFEHLQVGLLLLGLSTLAVIWSTIFLPMEREIAARSRAMEHNAAHDPLTDLLNRRAFAARTERLLDGGGTLLLIDFDDFKRINDTFGHLAGDSVLRRMADELRTSTRPSDVVARFGGDEFAVFARALSGDDATAYAERIARALSIEMQFDGTTVQMRCSIGVATTAPDVASLQRLLARADTALYAAKRSGRGRVVRFVREAVDTEISRAR